MPIQFYALYMYARAVETKRGSPHRDSAEPWEPLENLHTASNSFEGATEIPPDGFLEHQGSAESVMFWQD